MHAYHIHMHLSRPSLGLDDVGPPGPGPTGRQARGPGSKPRGQGCPRGPVGPPGLDTLGLGFWLDEVIHHVTTIKPLRADGLPGARVVVPTEAPWIGFNIPPATENMATLLRTRARAIFLNLSGPGPGTGPGAQPGVLARGPGHGPQDPCPGPRAKAPVPGPHGLQIQKR